MQLNSKSIFLRRVREAQLLKKISKRTANHFISVYKKFDSKKRSEADEKADELLAELITESTSKQKS
jgi:GTP1/Obg family GTP-binding protein